MLDVRVFLATAIGMLVLLAPFVGIGLVSVWIEDKFGIPGYATALLIVVVGIGIANGCGMLK